MIAQSPVTMVCSVEDIYETKGFENFICTIDATYAEESVLTADQKIDYHTLKPILFEMPTYEYLKIGDVIGKCMSFGKGEGWQPYPMASWINQNDLSGKIILPFYSHCGGAAGDFQENIVKRCPKADVREALSVIDDGEKSLGEILQSWMARNGIRVFQTV